ncbi:MAG: G2-specific serine/threonine protein kinase [Peltula sp. TS41687]|nr:MAG: G2-specific serine/threonine protein kinase [Peltula sp. TS41687]
MFWTGMILQLAARVLITTFHLFMLVTHFERRIRRLDPAIRLAVLFAVFGRLRRFIRRLDRSASTALVIRQDSNIRKDKMPREDSDKTKDNTAPGIRQDSEKGKYKLVKRLARGTGDPGNFNEGVHLVRRRQDSALLVQKVLSRREPLAHKKNEISILQGLQHKSILQCVDAVIMPNKPHAAAIYTEWCDLGTLDELLTAHWKNSEYLPEGFIRQVFLELADALAYCHYGVEETDLRGGSVVPSKFPGWLTVIHRDLKPSNVFLVASGARYPCVVVGDFGLAIRENDRRYRRKRNVGAPFIRAPDAACSPKVDVWAVGAIMQMLCRLDLGLLKTMPADISTKDWLGRGEAFDPKGAGTRYSIALNDAVAACQSLSPDDRPSSVELAVMLRKLFKANPVAEKPLPKGDFSNRKRWTRTLTRHR